MSRSESIADWSPSAASFVAPVLDGDQSACSPRECLNQFTRSTCPTNGDHLTKTFLKDYPRKFDPYLDMMWLVWNAEMTGKR